MMASKNVFAAKYAITVLCNSYSYTGCKMFEIQISISN